MISSEHDKPPVPSDAQSAALVTAVCEMPRAMARVTEALAGMAITLKSIDARLGYLSAVLFQDEGEGPNDLTLDGRLGGGERDTNQPL